MLEFCFAVSLLSAVIAPSIGAAVVLLGAGRGRFILRGVLVGSAALVLSFLLSVGGVFIASKSIRQPAIDGGGESGGVVLVFGCKTNGYEPSKTLRNRLDRAVLLLTELPEAICIVSGGEGEGEGVAEAESMRAYLVAAGIAEERIFVEDNSFSTGENIENSLALAEGLGLTDYRVYGVSNPYHLPRIALMMARYDVRFVPVPCEEYGSEFGWLCRDYFAVWQFILLGK
jgi:uncharacterized SAM-binding protein YcdF (DUF218 family)